MDGYEVFATVLFLAPPEAVAPVHAATPAEFDGAARCAAGASRLPHDAGLMFKVVGMDRETVQARVRTFWGRVRQAVRDRPVPPAFLWR